MPGATPPNQQNLLDFTHEAVIALDEDERITFWNRGAERMYGWTAAEASGQTLPELLRADCLRDAADALRSQERAATRTREFVSSRKDGTTLWVAASLSVRHSDEGQPVGFVAVHRDVTDRKQAEAKLRASEARMRALVDASPLGIDIMDLAGHPVFYNPKCVELHGLDLADAHDRGWTEAIHPDDRARVVSSWYEAAEARQAWFQTYRFLHRDGRVVWVSGRAAPMFVDGVPVGYAGTLEDITPLKQAEADRERLLDAERELRVQAERATRQRDETLAVVAHDLRNFISTILLGVARLERPGLSEEDRARRVAVIKRSAEATEYLIRDLLDASRIESGTLAIERSRVDFAALFRGVVELMQPRAAELGIVLDYEVAEDSLEVSGDRSRLMQVLLNLLDNALKFTPPPGRVSLQARRSGGEVEIAVEDSGRGIDAEALPHVFDRYWQAKRASRAGAGLGLTIAKGIVEAHGGRIWVESAPGRGTVFRFTIPDPSASSS
ncbi:PAS domain-containing sensor histidine kinase [Nannocystis sp. ILAH1]|uniref:sensor histidine kinase n=1 Tax=unclassified Nannocystis TaxID=2627009 RepID=UPI0022714B25|nr:MULTISPECIES: PAS domain-containing sensor histidine kinase [unclassified Nannocystis]MCY0994065.1 PAS domain-containing sensor histidine kinase [Nannocystis sp. ILAH1]MCY1067034.1 PAS domain-containing sensor histidine kinase [Nannocystis sp. RBIL2]